MPRTQDDFDFEILAPAPDASFGAAVVLTGDLDGDSLADIAVGAPAESLHQPLAGSVRAYSGRTLQELWHTAGERSSGALGRRLAACGDVDGDGVPDIASGAPGEMRNGVAAGAVLVLSGADGSVILALRPDDTLGLGQSVLGPGDLDGDGVPDIVAGAPPSSAGGLLLAGMVCAWSGRTGALLWRAYGEREGAGFGSSLALLDDRDGDGFPELAAGSPHPGRPTASGISVLSGRNGSLVEHFGPSAPQAEFGSSIAAIEDLDGDRHRDLLVLQRPAGQPFGGTVRILLVSSVSGAQYPVWSRTQFFPGSDFGTVLASAGVVTTSGQPDILVTESFDPNRASGGHAWLLSAGGYEVVRAFAGREPSSLLGAGASAGKDLDGDGRGDLVLGDPSGSTTTGARVLGWYLEPPPRASYALGHAGDPITLTTSLLEPGAWCMFLGSESGWGWAKAGPLDLALDLPVRILGTAIADDAGRATILVETPAFLAGRRFWWQGIEFTATGPPRASTATLMVLE